MSLRAKRYYKLFVALMLLVTTLVLGLGDQRIVAYTVADDQQVLQQAIQAEQSVALFFDAVIDSAPALAVYASAR